MKNNTWVIAAPIKTSYSGLTMDEKIEKYKKMSTDEFYSQFTLNQRSTKEPMQAYVAWFYPNNPKNITENVFGIAKYKQNPVSAIIHTVKYSEENGIPNGEANYVQQFQGDIDLAKELIGFYTGYGWKAEINNLKGADPDTRDDDEILTRFYDLRAIK